MSDPQLVDAYSEAREKALYPREKPFIAVYRKNGRALGFVAAEHGTDPNSPTFQAIDKAFDLIRPAALILEGFPTAWGESPLRIVRQIASRLDPNADSFARGEDVYAASLAVRRGIPFWGGEPTDAELAQGLLAQGFQPADIFYAAMFGPLAQDQRAGVFSGPADARFDAAYRRWAADIAKGYPPPASALDPASFRAWFARVYGRPIETDPNWSDHGGPGEPEIAGRIGRAQNLLRDRHLFELTIRLLNERRRVLVVYGGSHLSSHWRALQAALGPPHILPPV